ncbi:hypothetical protein GWE18_06560 [Bradyrhizobium sp. CSA112]|uniref:hypothetical protein n=1 Tax=Bradyrhizobium sp. CSA112 TaxID=2699170 RepID=UPI0023AE9ADF|nr:hypothetical protein [Bradyrhizobium sp. CSA112]MDE5452537.1 hypothetical protein [Bradyrhizobium sp. CSA112]
MTNLVDQQTLADRLRLTQRRVQQLEARGVIVRLPDGGYDFDRNQHRYRCFRDRDTVQVKLEIVQAAKDVDEMLALMRTKRRVSQRRRIAMERGPAIGRLDDAMQLSNAMADEHERQMLSDYTNMVVGRSMGEMFALCKWQLAD